MADCEWALDNLKRKINDMQKTMDSISHGSSMHGPIIDVSDLNDPGAMYEFLDAMQDAKTAVDVAKMFGCMTEKRFMSHYP